MGRPLPAAPFFSLKALLVCGLFMMFLVMGKQNIAELGIRRCFEKAHIWHKKALFSDCTGSVLVLISPHSVLLDSGGPRIRIHQIHLHKSRTK